MARRQFSDRDQGSAAVGPARTRVAGQGLASAAVAAVAFACYHATLVPGLDLGDSASFQTGVGSLTLTPRQAYPLYYGLGSVFVWLHPGDAARALNFASAVYAALAVAAAVWVTARLTGSTIAGIASGMFLAFSYTFWTQAVTAEVYTLHLLCIGVALVALLAWAERPTIGRLAVFYALYALSFGNHLSTILLLPAFASFLLIERRRGEGDPLRPAAFALAFVIAGLGALQYAWNFRGLWAAIEPPASIAEGLCTFWFDVTKADWRETLVMNVSETGLQTRHLMYWFDLRQQVGLPGVVLALVGLCFVTLRRLSFGLLLMLLFAANLAFAWTYNVGDAYIFFLPSHYVVALCAGAGIGAIVVWLSQFSRTALAVAASILLLLYPAWRGYDTFPAVDRSSDTRAVALLNAFTTPSGAAIFGTDSNWQIQNAVEYFMREYRPGVAWFTTEELPWLQWKGSRERFDAFLRANLQAGRRIVVTPGVRQKVRVSPTWHWKPDLSPTTSRLATWAAAARPGTPYVLAILRPDREHHLDTSGLARVWASLARDTPMPELRQYAVIVGRVGARPALVESRDRPYRVKLTLGPLDIDVRMESWLPTDTIRRAGFGHVVVNRRHALTIERSISFRTLEPDGEALYESGIFAPIPQIGLYPNP